MSRPARPYAPDPFHPQTVDPCCDGNAPVPRWTFYAGQIILAQVMRGGYHGSAAQLEADARAACIASMENPDRPWCRRCSTALEDFRDEVEDVLPMLLELVATIASFFPGIGTLVADVAGTCAALAAGESISDALIDGALSAIPGGPVWAGVARAGRDILDGQRVDRALVDGTRAAIAYEGGPLAAAAFDAVLALCQGKTIQDAGFAALKELASGNSLAERAANFAESMTLAVEQGKSVADVLEAELVADLLRVAGGGAAALVGSMVDRLKLDPSLVAWGSQALADSFGVAEPIARAAQAIMRTGSEDLVLSASVKEAARVAALMSSKVSASPQGQKNAAAAVYAVSTPAQRAEAAAVEARKVLIASPVHVMPSILAAATSRLSTVAVLGVARPPPPVAAPLVVAPSSPAPVKSAAPVTSSAPSSSATGYVIGGALGVATLAVLFFVAD